MADSPLAVALRSFEATEANLDKLERIWDEIFQLVPRAIVFGPNLEYQDRSRSYQIILQALPKIDGWKPEAIPVDLDDIASVDSTRPKSGIPWLKWRLNAHLKRLAWSSVSIGFDSTKNDEH